MVDADLQKRIAFIEARKKDAVGVAESYGHRPMEFRVAPYDWIAECRYCGVLLMVSRTEGHISGGQSRVRCAPDATA